MFNKKSYDVYYEMLDLAKAMVSEDDREKREEIYSHLKNGLFRYHMMMRGVETFVEGFVRRHSTKFEEETEL